MKVCKKVEEKGHTTYNEVADELVKEFISLKPEPGIPAAPVVPAGPGDKKVKGQFDEKNIRRRVYDALNVLMAMDIISKEKKEIRWKGLPSNAHHDLELLEREKSQKEAEVRKKRDLLRDLIMQGVRYRNLVKRNQQEEAETEAAKAGEEAKDEGKAAGEEGTR